MSIASQTASLVAAVTALTAAFKTTFFSGVIKPQVGTSYAFIAGDRSKVITHSNAAAIADALPQAGTTGFPAGWFVDVKNVGVGVVTITPATSTIDGAATLTLAKGQAFRLVSDGTNYFTLTDTRTSSDLLSFLHPLSGAVARSVASRLADTNHLKDHGTAVDTATLLAAVNAVKTGGGGILHVPKGVTTAVAMPDFANVLMEIDGPNVPGSQYGQAISNVFLAQKIFRAQDDVLHPDVAKSVIHIESTPKGSGKNGPESADFALSLSLTKQNFFAGAVAGEMDGMNITVRQGGGDSDVAAILGNVAQYGIGFSAFTESLTTLVVGSDITKQINNQVGVIDSRLGNSYGMVVTARVGVNTVGLLIQGNGPWTDPEAAYFEDLIVLRSGSRISMRINTDGYIYMRDDGPLASGDDVRLSVQEGVFFLNANNDGNPMMWVSQVGDANVHGSMGINNGQLTILGTQSVSATAGAGAAVPGAVAGYLNIKVGATAMKVPYFNT